MTLDQKIAKLEKLLRLANEDYASTKEVANLFAELLKKLKEVDTVSKTRVNSAYSEIKDLITKTSTLNDTKYNDLAGDVRKILKSIKDISLKDNGLTRDEVNKLIEESVSEINFPEIFDKVSDLAVEKVTPLIPEFPAVDQIRDQLELLGGDERLDKKAIRGLDEFIDRKDLNRAIEILDKRSQYLINKTIQHDSSLSGDGSSANPLRVVNASGINIVPNEIVSGSATNWNLANTPNGIILIISAEGQLLTPGNGNDYTISGAVITTANSYPPSSVLATYSH